MLTAKLRTSPFFGRVARPVSARAPAFGPPSVRARPGARRRALLPGVMAASAGPPTPDAPDAAAPENRGRFFEDVAKTLAQLAKTAPRNCAAGAWAGRFAAALGQYASARSAFEALSAASQASDVCRACARCAARKRMVEKLNILLLMKDRAPAELVARLGSLPPSDAEASEGLPSIGTWAGLTRALTLARSLLVDAPVAPTVLAPPPASDPIASLDYLRALLQAIDEVRIDVPDVALWSVRVKEALAHLDTAESRLRQQGPGPDGSHVLYALQSCDVLLGAEAALPFDVQTITRAGSSFESRQRWIDEAGDYLRGQRDVNSKCDRVRAFLRLRRTDLWYRSLPYQATFS